MATPNEPLPPPGKVVADMYWIQTFTGTKMLSSTSAKVYVILHGASGIDSPKVPLLQHSDPKNKNVFRKGCVDGFYVIAPIIPDLNAISVHYKGKHHSWYLDSIIIKFNGRKYTADFDKWMSNSEKRNLTCEDYLPAFAGGRLQLGPILKFRGKFGNDYRVSAMIVTESVPVFNTPLRFWVSADNVQTSEAKLYYKQQTYQMWRFDFQVTLQDASQICSYQLPTDERVYNFHVPGLLLKPSLLFCSCNDREHLYNMSVIDNNHKSLCWDYMNSTAVAEPFHLLIMGGDQVYADNLFGTCESVRWWDRLPKKTKHVNSIQYWSDKTVEELSIFYFKLYLYTWWYPKCMSVMASVPTTMMYDDHDIYDGWGSLDPHINNADFMINIFKVAKRFFFLFQMQGENSSVINDTIVGPNYQIKDTMPFPSYGLSEPLVLQDDGPFNIYLEMTGGVSVVMLDLRTERRMESHTNGWMMTENSMKNFEAWLQRRTTIQVPQHLFTVCTVPIHFPDSGLVNKLMDITHHELIDDVRDHYSCFIHRKEQSQLLDTLALFVEKCVPGTKATILSGDVHLGGFSTCNVKLLAKDKTITIEQYISSGICAEPPPKFAIQLMSKHGLFRTKEAIVTANSHITMTMDRLPSGKIFMDTQNFLCLRPLNTTYNAEWIGKPELTNKPPAMERERSASVLSPTPSSAPPPLPHATSSPNLSMYSSPHPLNTSTGVMFDWVKSIDAAIRFNREIN